MGVWKEGVCGPLKALWWFGHRRARDATSEGRRGDAGAAEGACGKGFSGIMEGGAIRLSRGGDRAANGETEVREGQVGSCAIALAIQ